jgi:DNA-binding response OmpR family regulator
MTHVLLIDDDELITRPLAAALAQAGYRVTVAHTGQRGLDLARAAKPDVVILDVLMPGMDGWQVCQALRQHSTVPILMLTALGE